MLTTKVEWKEKKKSRNGKTWIKNDFAHFRNIESAEAFVKELEKRIKLEGEIFIKENVII